MKFAIAGTALAVALFSSAAANAAPYTHEGRNQAHLVQIVDRNDHRDGHRDRGEFRAREFGRHERAAMSSERWRAGNWRHEAHDGRLGWWWIVDGDWFFYPEPIYPYPVYVGPAVYGPPLAAQSWYCEHPRGYYPNVRVCDGRWEIVPAIPPK